MKGVILGINPDVRIVDVTHGIDPQDVREGAFIIEECYRYFEKGTIHLAVIDPTVGSDRKPIIFAKDGYFFVGPDNGLFSLIFDDSSRIFAIENKRYMRKPVSSTFHGRDIFAPAAAYLASGVQLSAFGAIIGGSPLRLGGLHPKVEGNTLKGEVVRFDRFGNAITNISALAMEDFLQGRPYTVHLQDTSFPGLHRAYFEAEITCLMGSAGYLEFAWFEGSLRDRMSLHKGIPVVISVQ